MNSEPRRDARMPVTTRNSTPRPTMNLRCLSDQDKSGEYPLRNTRTTNVSTSLTLLGKSSEASTGVTVNVAISAPAKA